MKQKLIPLFFAFLAALAVKAGGIEIDSIRHPLIIDSRTDATLVNPSEGRVPSRKAAPSKIVRQNTDGENFNLVTTGTFTSSFSKNNSGTSYSYTAELRQSGKNPNRFLITPFIDNDEGLIVEITNNKNDAGAYILKVTPAATGYEHPSYNDMVWVIDAIDYKKENEPSNFDGTTFRLNLVYFINDLGSFGVFNETFEIPAGLVTYTEDPNDGILYYSITDADRREVSVAKLKDTERTTVDIPESVDLNGETYSVTSIGERAFASCTGLTSVTIPNSVTSIGAVAFGWCSNLTSVIIPNSVTSIGEQAFYDCNGLKDVYALRTSPAEYGAAENCFDGVPISIRNLHTLHVPTGCKDAYASTAPWSRFSNIVEPAVTGIYYSYDRDTQTACVEHYEYVGDIVIPASVTLDGITYTVTSIEDYAFSECTGLTSITIPESVTSIGEDAFSWCTGLTSVHIPESVTSIGEEAFTGCTGLTSITIPNSVTSIGDRAFWACEGLTSITISESVTSIGVQAFNGCSGLTSITIPNSVTSIGDYAFGGCYSLTSLSIGNSVTSIGAIAFYDCIGLTNVTIPNSVTSIGKDAFSGCRSLTSIQVDKDNTVYDSREDCNAIIETASNTLVAGCMNTVIPGSVTSIGEVAFNRCTGLTSITIPESVTSIGVGAFQFCTGLKDVYALRTSPAEYGADESCFYGVPTSTCTLHVPTGTSEAYASLAPWSAFENIVEFDPTAINQLEHNAEKNVSESFNLQGQRISVPQHGVNIIRYSDGTSKKILVK